MAVTIVLTGSTTSVVGSHNLNLSGQQVLIDVRNIPAPVIFCRLQKR